MTARVLRLGVPAAVAVVSFAAFLPALEGEFLNWDDRVNLLANTGYRGLGWAELRWMLTTTVMGHWIPLTWVSFAVTYVLGGLDPWAFHLGNLLLHALNALGVYFVALRLLQAARGAGAEGGALRMGAGLAALLFGVHPLRAESVAWITERRDVLSGLFFLLAVLAWLRAVDGRARPRPAWRAASVAAFLAALLSKASTVPLPLALLLLDVYPLRRTGLGWRRLVLEKAPHLLLALGIGLIGLWVLPQTVAVTGYDRYGPGARLGMVAYSLAFYPTKFLWASDLSPLYELPLTVDPLAPRFLYPIAAVTALTVLLVLLRRRWPGGLAAWAYSALMLLPVSGIVHSGHQLAHDRYSYLAGLGFALLAGAAIPWCEGLRRRGRVGRSLTLAVGAAACVAVLGLAAGAWQQSQIWRDSETLWRWAVDRDPGCAVCHLNLGQALTQGPAGEARIGEAEPHLRQAIALRPGYPEAHFNLGTLLMVQRRYAEAEVALGRYVALAPGAAEGPERLALLRILQGRDAEALPLLRRAALLPRAGSARARRLGEPQRDRGAAPTGQPPEAGSLSEALGLFGDDPETLEYLGRALVEQGRAAEALGPLRRALGLDPGALGARAWLVRAHVAAGQAEAARRELEALRARDPAAAERVERLVPPPRGSRPSARPARQPPLTRGTGPKRPRLSDGTGIFLKAAVEACEAAPGSGPSCPIRTPRASSRRTRGASSTAQA